MSSKFWERVYKTNYCWNWKAGKDEKGYGLFWCKKTWRAHRFSWVVHYGEIPNNLHVLHKCDNPKCVNPEHLFLGTNQDNVNDKFKKGRNYNVKGEKHKLAKLNDTDIIEIRKLYNNGNFTLKEIAKKYKVYYTTIQKIVTKQTWKHI